MTRFRATWEYLLGMVAMANESESQTLPERVEEGKEKRRSDSKYFESSPQQGASKLRNGQRPPRLHCGLHLEYVHGAKCSQAPISQYFG